MENHLWFLSRKMLLKPRDTLIISLIILLLLGNCQSRKRIKQLQKHPKETNIFNFVRLVVLRFIYGLAKFMGYEDGISDFAGGALVPPGADDYGYTDDYDQDYRISDENTEYMDSDYRNADYY